jgi:hypothetical protein
MKFLVLKKVYSHNGFRSFLQSTNFNQDSIHYHQIGIMELGVYYLNNSFNVTSPFSLNFFRIFKKAIAVI